VRELFALLLVAAAPSGAQVDELLQRSRAHYDNLEFDQVIPLAAQVLGAQEATPEQRLDAYVLQASCLAIVGRAIDAEQPFRLLLRMRPEFDLGDDTPPKILAVFRKVQVEEKTIADQIRAMERERMLAEMSVAGGAESDAVGGEPVRFLYRIRDPRGVVAGAELHYRRAGRPAFSVLALERGPGGEWGGDVPASWTENTAGMTIEHYLSTADASGAALLAMGTADSPLQLTVAPGEIAEPEAFYETVWFWATTAAVVVAGAAASVVAVEAARSLPDSDLGQVDLQ